MRRMCSRARAVPALLLALLLIIPAHPPGGAHAGSVRPLPAGAPEDPCYETDPILATQDVTLDALPIAVVYHPPGWGIFADAESGHEETVGQELTLTEKFGTSTRVTEMTMNGESNSVGLSVSYKFITAEGESGQGQSAAQGQETGTWNIQMNATSWPSGLEGFADAPEPFPGSGDRIVFFYEPQFQVTYRVGHVHTEFECELPPDHDYRHIDGSRVFRGMEPINLEQWSRRSATVWELRQGIGNGQQAPGQPFDAALVEKLLALDPLASPGMDLSERRIVLPDVRVRLAEGRLGPPRFIKQSPWPWSSCDDASRLEQTLQMDQYTSVTTTYKYTGTLTVAGSVTIPIYGVEIEPAGSYGQTFGFEYSRNEMTEHGNSTDAVAIIGGGDECPSDWYETEVWYDSTFGTLAFPTRKLPEANVQGRVLGPGGAGLPAARVIVEDAQGARIRTRSDPSGQYGLYLEPGRYTVLAEDRQRGPLSQRLAFEVPAGRSGPLQLEPLQLGQTGEVRPLDRTIEPATPTPTPGPRTLPR